jgi:hypothetical protein
MALCQPPSRRLGAVLACCAALGLGGGGTMPAALADPTPPPECPQEPATYTGSDDAVLQLNALRRDEHQTCLALVARLDALDGRVAHLASAADDVRAAMGGTLGSDLAALRTRAEDPAPRAVNLANPEAINGPQAQAVASSADTLHADAWWALGLACALAFGYGLYRQVMPRA